MQILSLASNESVTSRPGQHVAGPLLGLSKEGMAADPAKLAQGYLCAPECAEHQLPVSLVRWAAPLVFSHLPP